jgi:UDP-glucose 4-epimerase
VPARVVFASTAAVYGRAGDQPIKETAPVDVLNPYASSKLAAEDALRWKAETGKLFNVAGAADGRGDPDRTRNPQGGPRCLEVG